ncbi:cytochrome P450 [Hysterangium stoloniferum]|nr:cytochrome P450 [Hysterangium stoloniferum]
MSSSSLFLAGHETTATTMAWALYDLAKSSEYQTLVRDEIKATRTRVTKRGGEEISDTDLDSMKYLLPLIKETLRFHPIIPTFKRESKRDDIIPLCTTITTKTGEAITTVRIATGQKVRISIIAYNRLKSVWGDDADVWRPERFMDGSVKQGVNLGVLVNILVCSFSLEISLTIYTQIIEMQVILIELLESFEFSPPPGNVEIRWALASLVTPM